MYSFTWITVLICRSDNREENICSDASVSPALRRKQCNRAQWWFTTLPLSLSAVASVCCGGQQGALMRAICDRSLSTGSQGRSGGTILMRIILAPQPQPSSPSPSLILSPVPAGSAVYYFLTSNGLLPEAATSWQRLTRPSRQKEQRGALWKEEKSCTS